MATRIDISPAMQCVVDISSAAKRAATDNKGTTFGTKCSILAMAADMVLGDMTMTDFLGVTVAEVEATKR
jgi:hypothetical protein